MECTDCHTGIDESRTLADMKRVNSSACLECHEGDMEFDDANLVVFSEPSFQIPSRTTPGDLLFSHQSHIKREQSCKRCHGEIIKDSSMKNNQPSMVLCMDCHEQKANAGCLTCHSREYSPDSHQDAGWLRSSGHAQEQAFNEGRCRMCHESKSFCIECHQGVNGRRIHNGNYRYSHGIDVKFSRLECSTCHVPVGQFCADCHEGEGRK